MATPQERADELLRYLDRWRASHSAFYAWVRAEWLRRLGDYKALRKRAREKLLQSGIENLKTDAHGRVASGNAAAAKAKRAFAQRRDRILAAVVEEGENIFGISGQRDRAGIYHGDVSPELKKAALAQLKASLRAQP